MCKTITQTYDHVNAYHDDVHDDCPDRVEEAHTQEHSYDGPDDLVLRRGDRPRAERRRHQQTDAADHGVDARKAVAKLVRQT